MLEFTSVISVVAASSSDSEGDWSNIGFVFLLSGFIFYGAMFLMYRNADKRHRHESETRATKQNVVASDVHVQSLKGLSNSKMRDANNRSVRGAANSFMSNGLSAVEGISPIIGQIRRQIDNK